MKNSLKKIVNFFLFFFFLFFIIPFAISNKEYITINLFPFPIKIDTPLYLFILILFFAAFILGYIFSKIKR